MTRILVIGCGSIGLRHIRALKTLGKTPLFAYRTHLGQNKQIPQDIKRDVKEIYDEKEAIALSPTHVIISNPTVFHIKSLNKFIRSKTRIFVEKPLVGSYEDIKDMSRKILEKVLKNKGMVGFNFRFHLIFQKLKKLIEDNSLGEPLFASLNAGHYLPFWHPSEDYRLSYASRSDLGGGVLRTLSHELDLVFFLFGQIKEVFARVEKISELEIDVDDCVDIILSSDSCKRVKVHLDYLFPTPRRYGEILFEKGLIEYNYFNGEIHKTTYKGKKKQLHYKVPEDYSYNHQYRDQMSEFMSGKTINGCSIKEGIENVKLIELCERSSREGIRVCFN